MKINNRFNKILSIITIIVILPLFAQAKVIKGRILGINENGQKIPLPNATIKVNNSKIGTIADKNGEFELEVNPPAELVATYFGYKLDTILVQPETNEIEFVLYQEFKTPEVVVEKPKPDFILENSSIVKTEVITGSGLKKAACCNLSESFLTNPTVDVTYTDAVTGVKQIQLLGLAQNYTQLMVEIVPNLQGIASNYGLLFVPGPWINSISISKGTSSVTRGYESITGQINVELKGPESSENLIFNNYLNDIFRLEANIITKFELEENIFLTNLIHSNYFNKKIDHNGDGFLDIPTNKQINILERLDYSVGNFEGKTFVHWLLNNSKSGQVWFFDSPNSNSYWGSNVDIQRINLTTKNGFIFDEETNRNIGTILSFIHHKQNSYFGQRTYNAEQNSVFATILFSSSYNLLEGSNDNSETNLNYTFGLSYQYNNYLQILDNLDLSTRESVGGLFAEFTVNPLENFQIISGIRLDFHNIAGKLFTPRIHIKYQLNENNIIRVSAGKGYHFPLPIPENQGILTSSREITFKEELKIEEAWNFGINTTHNIEMLGRCFVLNLEFFHTKFINQTIVDRDIAPDKIYIYNLNGKSFSNSFQIDLTADIFSNLTILAAYRLNDVWTTTNWKLQRKPLISPHKALFNIAYKPEPFMFDVTLEYNGGGRIPETNSNPAEYKLPDTYNPYFVLYGQVTYKIGKFEIYIGSENITNFRQPNPIVAYKSPFSNYFDGSMIWGPIEGRKTYLGLRYNY
ncbi:MAG: TonB-dependent receptor [Ignavibacteria bacterium]|nr:TonB-dependent receptor [Ignavibacteria bacterium]